ncbi:acetoacetate--CoA ligase [Streptomyces sp. NA04227]|uniref:acetoacetate--CoA ligase n=1 Tax=Streptomyces sp. NA04227 TaxID=2742136 RepID=UPI001591E301|nr:acetoacetate--CoA ligase [Streptomyces sp. NA04227]QKW09681.1 acetoacetate--CoA ligase [Streptomyces sp. NA04227]
MLNAPADSTRPVLWTPSEQWIAAGELTRFQDWLAHERGLAFDGYDELWRWSVENTEGFWRAVWDYFEVRADGDPTTVLTGTMPGARWFPDVALNYAERILVGRDPERVALVHASESQAPVEVTWAELTDRVTRARAGLVAAGVGPGDRVAAYLPNTPEAVVALLATTSLGAVWSVIAPETGAASALDRFRQIEPSVLITVDGYRYAGREFDRLDQVREIVAGLPTLTKVVVADRLRPGRPLTALTNAVIWDDFCADRAPLEFARVPFDHPLWILYSSGTTGAPKPIVHGHGGIVLEHLKKLHFHVDARRDDRILWFTSTGWMMWNFLVGGLLTDAAVVLYDGSPRHPDTAAMWDVVEATRTTCFGTSAGFLTACRADGVRPREGRDLGRLRAVGSTGSPLTPEVFDWVYDELGPDLWLFSSSGGTDVCTSFIGGVPTLPVVQGELQRRSLGAPIAAWDDEGRPLTGEVGELVLTAPMPSMPVKFWGDTDGSRYRDAYFGHYRVEPPVWRHGDWIEITPQGGVVIYGRSDSTINRGGIRMGTSEIYRSVLTLDAVVDALALDIVEPDASSRLELFVVLAAGHELDGELERALAARLRTDCSPRHVPDAVHRIDEVPRTRSGKPLEVPMKRLLMGAELERVVDRDAVVNPQALEPFRRLARQRADARAR